MKKFKKASMIISIVLLVVLVSVLLVSFIVANIHKVSVITEWKNWGHAIANGWHKMINWAKK